MEKSFVAHKAFQEFKDYIGKLTGQPEIAQGHLIKPMEALCSDYGLKGVYFVLMQAYWDEQGKNQEIDDQVKIEYAKSITPLQSDMLKKIALDEMTESNGAEPEVPEQTVTWANRIIESPQDKECFDSLLNAGLVWIEKAIGSGIEGTVGLTHIGFCAYKNVL